MNILSCLFFLLVGLGFVFVSYRCWRDILSPIAIFSFVWFFSVGITQLMLSNTQHLWTFPTWFAVFGSALGFITGSLSYSLLVASRRMFYKKLRIPNHYSKHRLRLVILLLFVSSALAYLFEIYKFGGVPLFSGARIGAYMNFGVRFVHYLTVSSVLVCMLIFVYRKLFVNGKKLLLNIIFVASLLIIISLLASGQILMILVGSFIIKHYLNEKKLGLKYFVWLTVFGVILFTLLTGYIRSSANDITYVKKIGQPKFDIPDSLSPLFLPYLYVSTSFENLQLEIEQREKFHYGAETFHPIWAFTLTKSWFETTHYITPAGFTTGTYLRSYYVDFSFVGVLIGPFLLGLAITVLYHSFRIAPTIFNLLAYSFCVYGLMMVFFANIFNKPLLWYFLILCAIIDFYCRNNCITKYHSE